MKIIGVGKFIKQNPGGKIIIPEPTYYEIRALDLELTKIEIYGDPRLQQTGENQTNQTNNRIVDGEEDK